jgi:hypothetical protein
LSRSQPDCLRWPSGQRGSSPYRRKVFTLSLQDPCLRHGRACPYQIHTSCERSSDSRRHRDWPAHSDMFRVPDRPATCPAAPYQRELGIVSAMCELGRACPGYLCCEGGVYGRAMPGHDEAAMDVATAFFSCRRLILISMETRLAVTETVRHEKATIISTPHPPARTGRSGGAGRTTARPASPRDRNRRHRSRLPVPGRCSGTAPSSTAPSPCRPRGR